jgi:hypothetical protein
MHGKDKYGIEIPDACYAIISGVCCPCMNYSADNLTHIEQLAKKRKLI